MTWPTRLAAVLTLLSILAQVLALDEVRTWGSRSGQSLARRLGVAWRSLHWRLDGRQPVTLYPSSTTHTHRATSPGVSTMPADLAAGLAPYAAAVAARLDTLERESSEHARSLAGLQARAERADALAEEQRADARRAGGLVIAGAVLATLALLVQAGA